MIKKLEITPQTHCLICNKPSTIVLCEACDKPKKTELQTLLETSGMSDMDLSRILHVSLLAIMRWKKGTSAPHAKALPVIIKILKGIFDG